VQAIQGVVGPEFRVVREGPFVIAGRSRTLEELHAAGRELSRYMEYDLNAFAMERPDHLITVYLARSVRELADIASRVHGLRLSEMSLGYSYEDDMSMAGVVPSVDGVGTLKHELFHLLVRGDFGDAPAWLDEGIAAMHESSTLLADGTMRWHNNWRGDVLREFGFRATVEQLVRANWYQFDALDVEPENATPPDLQQAIHHATARYFAMYLDEHGWLKRIYRTFRERTPLEAERTPDADAVWLVEQVTGASVPDLERDFRTWFRQLPR
jgi:hypothetical protein